MKSIRRRRPKVGAGAVRCRLGLNQIEFADILNITRSALVMNEIGKRGLNGKALMKSSLLQIGLDQTAGQFRLSPNEPHEKEETLPLSIIAQEDALLAREVQCHNQAGKLMPKLAAMKERYTSIRHWLHIIETNLQQPKNLIPHETEWWIYQHAIAIDKLADCNMGVQKLLQSKINLLLGEADVNKKVRANLKCKTEECKV